MKILMITTFYPPYHVGGACLHVYYLANELAKQGHHITVIHCIDSFYLKRKGEPNNNYKNHPNIRVYSLKSGMGKISPLLSYVTGLPIFKDQIRKIAEENYDLIHYHNISLLGPKVLDYGKAKKIMTAHDTWLIDPKSATLAINKKNIFNIIRPPQLYRYYGMINQKLKSVSKIIIPSNFLYEIISKNGLKLPPHHVVPNFAPVFPESRLVKSQDYKKYFLYAGRLDELKGVKELLATFKGLNEFLYIAGDGELKDYTTRFIAKNGLKRKIKYLGNLHYDDLMQYYYNAKAYILPSICFENSPLGVLEALSVGTPSLVADKGGSIEIITDKRLQFKSGDIDDMRSKITKFNPQDHSSKKLIELYRQKYSPAAYLKRYYELI